MRTKVPLKSCPFCDGEAVVEHDPPRISEIDRYKIYIMWRAVCTQCGAKIERLQEYRYDGKHFRQWMPMLGRLLPKYGITEEPRIKTKYKGGKNGFIKEHGLFSARNRQKPHSYYWMR